MKEQIARTWVEALRSGDYKQTAGVLYDGEGYCCLGVLCRVMGYKFEVTTPSVFKWHVADVTENESSSQLLPRKAMVKAGIKSNNGQVNFVTEDGDSEQITLAEMNDNGQNFETIADFIEENWQAL